MGVLFCKARAGKQGYWKSYAATIDSSESSVLLTV